MKLLTISQTWFELPEDFEGSVADALRLTADYLDTPTKAVGPGSKNGTFGDFLKTIKEGGKLYSTGLSVQFLNKEKTRWENQPRKIVFKEESTKPEGPKIRCLIQKYDPAIKEPPFKFIDIGEFECIDPRDGNALFGVLIPKCKELGYTFKFYSGSSDKKYDYVVVVKD